MKKYKLIKEYPESPTLNSIVEKQGKCYEVISDNIDEGRKIHSNFIENFPEFWEEVLERDYEVLEVTGFIKNKKDLCRKFYLSSNSYYVSGKLKQMFNLEDIDIETITKVKRLSDGEVFKVGDNVS